MGSIGLYSGTLRGESVDAILKGQANYITAEGVKLPERINIFPSTSRRDNAFVIDFTDADPGDLSWVNKTWLQDSADQTVRYAFLRYLRRPINVQNADRRYAETYNDAINAGMTEAQARHAAEDIRVSEARSMLERFLSRQQSRGRFAGVVIRDFGRRRG